jgi:hypothetical protein
MVEADIHLRPRHTSILDIYKLFQQLVYAVSRAYAGCTIIPLLWSNCPQVGGSGSLEEWKLCHNVMVDADIHLRPLLTSMLYIYKVFEPLVCCLKGIWLHPYTVTLAKLPPDLGIQVHLRSGNNDATTSWLRLIATSDHFIHP